jgi:N-acetylglucosamine kinase-like BadF-type ATPase
MILIADSGSTKCDWAIIQPCGEVKSTFKTMGLNPYFHDEGVIENALLVLEGQSSMFSDITHLFFYGAGSSSEKLCARMKRGLQRVFSQAEIVVDHDLVGAAYSTYDGSPGITSILGTGSNSCFFDGENLREEVPALAYILGDEASGSYFGKVLLQEYFYKQLPNDIRFAFEAEYHVDHDTIVDRVYNEENANVYLASFMPFIGKFKDHPHVIDWVADGMRRFIQIHVKCFPESKTTPIHFVGSIAHYFSHCLEMVMADEDLKLGKVLKAPIDGLVDYHVKFLIPELQD